MATIKEKLDKAIQQLEKTQKAKAAAARSGQYNTAMSEIAKKQAEIKRQSS